MDQINSDFRRYYYENWQLVYYTAYKVLNIREAAEDVASDVFVSLYKQMLVKPVPEDKVRAWLVISAKRRAYNYVRDNKRFVSLDANTPGDNLYHRIDDNIFVSEMLNCLHRHNKRWFDTIVKFYLLGMSASEIAVENQCSEQAIRNILQRARDYLRAEYKSTDVSLLFVALLTVRIYYILLFLDVIRLLD